MAIMWTMDPAVHRTFMWLMHLSCYSCFSPAAFAGRPDTLNVIAKMAANVVLFTWAFSMAVHARRLNKITVVNGSLQYLVRLVVVVVVVVAVVVAAVVVAAAAVVVVVVVVVQYV